MEITVSANERLDPATVTIDNMMSEPKHLIALLARQSLPTECGSAPAMQATGQRRVAELLEAAWGDWVDSLCPRAEAVRDPRRSR